MDVIGVLPDLYYFRFAVGNAYLWRDADGLTLIDAGPPGSGPAIATAIRDLGHDPADLRRLILTHGHIDHIGGAADIATWGDVTVLAHRADAPVIRGEAVMPPPQLADWERPILDRAQSLLPPEPPEPVRVDRELEDGDEIDFAGGAVTVAVPGHTPGSIALYLPARRVLFTGDIAARNPEATTANDPVILGVFNIDPPQAATSFRRLADLDTEVACFGHGDPLTQNITPNSAKPPTACTNTAPTARAIRTRSNVGHPAARMVGDPAAPAEGLITKSAPAVVASPIHPRAFSSAPR